MIEFHYIEVIIFLALWIISVIIAYGQGMNSIIGRYEDALESWGETIKHYKELHSMYKKLLDEYKESQSKIHMN